VNKEGPRIICRKTTESRAASHICDMKNTNIPEPDSKSSEVIHLLQQIERLNIMIEEHQKTDADDALIVEQYEVLRADFLTELAAVLSDYGIAAELKISD